MDYGNCFTLTETPCWAISGSEARSCRSLTHAVSPAQGGKPTGSCTWAPGLLLLCAPPATAVESQGERVAVAHSDILAGLSEASQWRAACGVAATATATQGSHRPPTWRTSVRIH